MIDPTSPEPEKPDPVKELCKRLRSEATELEELFKEWPAQYRFGDTYLGFKRDIQDWRFAARTIEQLTTDLRVSQASASYWMGIAKERNLIIASLGEEQEKLRQQLDQLISSAVA